MTGWRNRVRARGIEVASGLFIVLACVVVVQVTRVIPGLA